MSKPTVFNYQNYVKALETITELKEKLTNAEIKMRIMEDNHRKIPVNATTPVSGMIRGRCSRCDQLVYSTEKFCKQCGGELIWQD